MGRGSSQWESKISGGREKVFNSQSMMFRCGEMGGVIWGKRLVRARCPRMEQSIF